MAFIVCDEHSITVEAEGIDPISAKRLMLDDTGKPDATSLEREVMEFGRIHRECSVRVIAD